MKVGVNYTPRQGWFHSWLDFDPDEVARDMDAIAALGLDHVRVFPLWPLLQPSRGVVSTSALSNLLQVVDLAGRAGLTVSVDVLNGHLSSFDFLPSWVSTWHQRDLFTHPDVVDAQARLVTEVAGALATRDNASGVCLGNEFLQFAAPRHPHPSRPTPAQADAWLGTLLAAAHDAFPEGRHVFSFDDDLFFCDEHPFCPDMAVRHGDLTTVHSWVFGGTGQRFGAGHPALTAFARYLLELAAAWDTTGARPLWLQEVGAPISFVSADDAPAFLQRTLRQVCDMPRLQAVTWWCSHDVSRSLPDFPELEYSLGLFDSDGRVKPIGAALREMLPDLHAAQPLACTAATPERPVLEFSATAQTRSTTHSRGDLFDRWLAEHLAGRTPALRHV